MMIGASWLSKARRTKIPDMAEEGMAAKEVIQLREKGLSQGRKLTTMANPIFWVSGRSLIKQLNVYSYPIQSSNWLHVRVVCLIFSDTCFGVTDGNDYR